MSCACHADMATPHKINYLYFLGFIANCFCQIVVQTKKPKIYKKPKHADLIKPSQLKQAETLLTYSQNKEVTLKPTKNDALLAINC